MKVETLSKSVSPSIKSSTRLCCRCPIVVSLLSVPEYDPLVFVITAPVGREMWPLLPYRRQPPCATLLFPSCCRFSVLRSSTSLSFAWPSSLHRTVVRRLSHPPLSQESWWICPYHRTICDGMGTTEWRATKSPAYYKLGDYVPGLKVRNQNGPLPLFVARES